MSNQTATITLNDAIERHALDPEQVLEEFCQERFGASWVFCPYQKRRIGEGLTEYTFAPPSTEVRYPPSASATSPTFYFDDAEQPVSTLGEAS